MPDLMDEKAKPEIRRKTRESPPGGGETGAGLGTYPHTPLPIVQVHKNSKNYLITSIESASKYLPRVWF